MPIEVPSSNRLQRAFADRRMTHDIVRNEDERADIFDDLEA